jgi:ribonuclease E
MVRGTPGAAVIDDDRAGAGAARPSSQTTPTTSVAERTAPVTTEPPEGRRVWPASGPGALVTDENTPTTDSLSTEDQPVRRTRARRVATSGTTTPRTSATAPVPAEAGADAPPAVRATALTTPPTADVPSGDAPSAPARSRSRRATSGGGAAKAGPAADAAPADAPLTKQSAPDPAPSEAAGEAAPTRARRSRRATSGGSAEQAAPAAPAQQAPPEPEVAARTGRTSRRRASSAQTPALDVLAELEAVGPSADEQRATQQTAEPAAQQSKLPAAALMFQAPVSRSRGRRAMAPAGPPRHETGTPDDTATTAATSSEAQDGARVDEAGTAGQRTPRSRRGSARQPVVEELVEDLEGDEDAEELDGDELEQGDEQDGTQRRRRRRGGRGRRSRSGTGDRDDAPAEADEAPAARRRSRGPAPVEDGVDADAQADADLTDEDETDEGDETGEGGSASSRRRRRRRRGSRADDSPADEPAAATSTSRTRTRTPRAPSDEVTALKGSTRLEAKRQRRREGRDAGRRRTIVTESEFLARRESVERSMIVREANDRVQIAVLEDGVLVEHFVSRSAQNGQSSMAGNVYLGRVQNVLPSMEAAFVDVGKGRNAVLYAGEVNWDAAGLEGQPRRIEQALKSGDSVLVQVTKDPIGHKGARLTSQVTLAGRYLVYVPGGGMTGISRKLPENERARLKKLLKEIVPDAAGVIVRTAAEGASEEELRRDVQRLQDQWAAIEKKAKSATAPALLQGEPDLAIRVVRDIFNDDFSSLVVQGDEAWHTISDYVAAMAPDLAEKVSRWTGSGDVFAAHRIDEQLAKGMDRKVWLPSGGSLVIDRTEAMTVVDVNTGKFTGSGGTLEETVTRNNIEAAEEIVRQLRLRDIGGIIVIDFIDMVLESNRDLVLRRLVECLGRDRTKHQVAEVTSLGLVQMTRKRVGQGLVEAFSETCQHCNGRGFIVHSEPIDQKPTVEESGRPAPAQENGDPKRSRRKKAPSGTATVTVPVLPEAREAVKATLATIAAAAAHAHEHDHHHDAQAGSPEVEADAETPDWVHETADPAEANAELMDALSSIEAVETIEPTFASDSDGDPDQPDWVVIADEDPQPDGAPDAG